MSDLLDMAKLNALPQPLYARYFSTWWPVESIDVETGLMRIDVCGKLDVLLFGGLLGLRDANGVVYDTDDFYMDEP